LRTQDDFGNYRRKLNIKQVEMKVYQTNIRKNRNYVAETLGPDNKHPGEMSI
jgi:hypothetical protein